VTSKTHESSAPRNTTLTDILVIAILAIIAGAQGWEDIENYGISKQKWLEEFLALPNGIPSDDTFRRVFEFIDPWIFASKLSLPSLRVLMSVTINVLKKPIIARKSVKFGRCLSRLSAPFTNPDSGRD
jgi:hypothetical protein